MLLGERTQRRFGGGFGGGFGRFGYNGPRASREELLERMRDHIHTVVGRYKGKIKVWDVVNEAIADGGTNILRNSLWFEIIGPDYVAKAFQYAHEADPDAILRYNDYGLENASKRRKLIELIQSLKEQGVRFMHWFTAHVTFRPALKPWIEHSRKWQRSVFQFTSPSSMSTARRAASAAPAETSPPMPRPPKAVW